MSLHSIDMRWLKRIAAGLVMAYVLVVAGVWVVVSLPPARFAAIMSRLPTSENPGPLFMIVPIGPLMMLARAGHLHPGDTAPDFRLHVLHSQETVQLASFRGQKAVVLIFGSYTWPPFRREVPALNKLYRQYKDQVAFYVVYILEAHANDSWKLAGNVSVATPRNFVERDNVASSCVRKLGIEMPALVDNLDKAAETAYTGWPDRLYLVDRDGRIAYKSGPGPFGFEPKELEGALKRVAPAVKVARR